MNEGITGTTLSSSFLRAPSALLLALGSLLFALCVPVEAQQPGKVRRIAYLSAASASSQVTQLEAFRQGLRKLGYSEGKNIVIEERYEEENRDGRSELAASLSVSR